MWRGLGVAYARIAAGLAIAFAAPPSGLVARDAAAQPSPRVPVELPDKSVVNVGDSPTLSRKLQTPLAAWQRSPGSMSKWKTVFAPAAAFCPVWMQWADDDSGATINDARSRCDAFVAARLVHYDAAARGRCGCVKIVEGRPSERLRVTAPILLDPYEYDTALFTVSRGGAGEILRGYAARGNADFRLFNERQQPVCHGDKFEQGVVGTFSCFGGRVTARGTYRYVRETGASGPVFYFVGRFELSNGERLDFVTGLTDVELKQRLPNFPN